MTRDSQRSRVYAAEEAWALRLDAARLGARRAVVAGSAVTLPAEVRFGTLADAQRYADAHTSAHSAARTAAHADGLPPVLLRERQGQAAAHYEPPGTIALPLPRHGEPWALRETVLLHELAHHACFHATGAVDHGPSYTGCMLELVAQVLGEEAAFALRVEYGEHGVA